MKKLTAWLMSAAFVLVVVFIATRIPMVRNFVFGAPKTA